MKNNIICTVILIFMTCLYMFNSNTIEGYWNISGSRVQNAYLPQPVKQSIGITNYSPHGSNLNTEQRELETFNYNPKDVMNKHLAPETQFNDIENFQMQTNNKPIFKQNNYNTRSPQSLPKNNLSDTHIPVREDYQTARGVGTSKVTPMGYRNGAKPHFGAGLLRGEVPIREDYSSGSMPQFGSFNDPAGNIQIRGGKQIANARGLVDINPRYQLGQRFSAANQNSAGQVANTVNQNVSVNESYTVGLPRRVRDDLNDAHIRNANKQGFQLPTLDDEIEQQYQLPVLEEDIEQQYQGPVVKV